MTNTHLQEKINQHLFNKLQLAYICVDHAMIVKDVSANLGEYGFEGVTPGCKITDHVDFMVGVDTHSKLDLPLVSSPSEIPVSVTLMPEDEQLVIIIANASSQAEQRQMLQQAANENELLVGEQKKLLAKLEAASLELAAKNGQLEESSRLQTSFLSGVSHEFRTPLTSIIGYTNLVCEAIDEAEHDPRLTATVFMDSASHLDAVQRSSKHLLSLVENLLDHGKLNSDEIVVRPKATELHQVFDDVDVLLRPMCNAKNISLAITTSIPANVTALVDDSRLRQCLINLMGNAVKFTDEGGVSVDASWQDEHLSVTISDTGPGISSQDIDKIRLPFWQGADTGKAGTGLGLTITEKIIELMGGTLTISSTPDVGTTVEFDMPAPVLFESAESSAAKSSFTLKVLMAEDDLDIADLIVMMLSERGADITHVENGAAALDTLESSTFDIVLMDLNMPVMSGYDAIEQMRARQDTTPVVVMSASSLDTDRARAEQVGCDGYLVKPVDVDDIFAIAMQLTS